MEKEEMAEKEWREQKRSVKKEKDDEEMIHREIYLRKMSRLSIHRNKVDSQCTRKKIEKLTDRKGLKTN